MLCCNKRRGSLIEHGEFHGDNRNLIIVELTRFEGTVADGVINVTFQFTDFSAIIASSSGHGKIKK